MTEKLKIPRAAMPVVKVLRRDVERPGGLPVAQCCGLCGPPHALAWTRRHPAYPKGPVACCPMGLHPASTDNVPSDPGSFPAPAPAIAAFAFWWDDIPEERAAEAVEAVWPTRKGRKA